MESFPSEGEAERAVRAARRRIPGMVSVEVVLDRYELNLRRKGNKPSSVTSTMIRLRNWHEETMAISDVTAYRLRKRYERRCEEVAVDTHRNELAEVKTFWRWCVKCKLVSRSPAEKIEPLGRRKKGKKQLRRSEARRFFIRALELADRGHDGAIGVMAVVMLGLRSSELRLRTVRDLDVDEDGVLLWIDRGKTEAAVRYLEVPEPLAGYLVDQAGEREDDAWLFPSRKSSSGHREKTWLLKVVKRICREAEVPEITPHGLRGTWATLTTEAGVAGHLVARELGHTSPSTTTKHYTKKGAVERSRSRRMLTVLEGGKKA